MSIPLKLSVLDQSPMAAGESAETAFQHTIQLARCAEEWGYHRFWVAEHHSSNRNMGSSPEVLISHLLARTDSIRIGSGGVMLQHYSPYKVAENFNVLASLAPGRVDLGIGRGPGGMPLSTQALRPQPVMGPNPRPLEEKLSELKIYLHGDSEEGNPHNGVRATPIPPQPADLFLLGTTAASAEMAADQELPYVFAMFLNGDEDEMQAAMDAYHGRCEESSRFQPRAMLALPVIVADSDQEAAGYARDIHVVRIRLASGRTFTVFSEDAAREFGRQSGENFTYQVQPANVISGSAEKVGERLIDLARQYRAEEIFAVTAIDEFQKRLRSYQLLSQVILGKS